MFMSIETSPPPLEEIIDPSWAKVLAPVEPQIRQMGELLRQDLAEGNNYLPAGPNILRAFAYPFEDVKVLILGQDPYPTVGNATGLAFSVGADMPLPASLRNIYQEIEDDLSVPAPPNGDLTGWAEQGVCLLNRVLTVSPGRAGSHRGRGWEQVTAHAVQALANRDAPLVAVLWGRDAQSAEPLLGATPVVKSYHPSPLSASRGFFGSKPFSKVNELLELQGATPINWSGAPSLSGDASDPSVWSPNPH